MIGIAKPRYHPRNGRERSRCNVGKDIRIGYADVSFPIRSVTNLFDRVVAVPDGTGKVVMRLVIEHRVDVISPRDVRGVEQVGNRAILRKAREWARNSSTWPSLNMTGVMRAMPWSVASPRHRIRLIGQRLAVVEPNRTGEQHLVGDKTRGGLGRKTFDLQACIAPRVSSMASTSERLTYAYG